MALLTSWQRHTLQFTFAAGTSRGVLREKNTWLIKLWDEENSRCFGLGEAGPLVGLSVDDRPDFEEGLARILAKVAGATLPAAPEEVLAWAAEVVPEDWPSVRFGLETAALDLLQGGTRTLYPGPFVQGHKDLEINGLIWMGDAKTMQQRLQQKLEEGFKTIKLKIGAIDFAAELELLGLVRERFGPEEITLRVDANGAFAPKEAMAKLEQLAAYDLHSIEQPIGVREWREMAALCAESPVPVALDEELIGVQGEAAKADLLDAIRPPYIILKPTLVGGLASTAEWIRLAEARNIGWWITSALESNVGLNAIAQFTAEYPVHLPQGLGTGQLYHNNVPAPLEQKQGWLHYNAENEWDLKPFFRD